MMTQSEVPVNPSQSDLRILWLPALICVLLLAVELYLLFTDWGSRNQSNTRTDATPIAIYVSGKNDVRQKTVGTLVWEPPVPEMHLYQESAIATMDDSEAIIRFNDDSELVVEPNSLLILEEAPTGMTTGQAGRIVARLVKGSVKRKQGKVETQLFLKLSRAKDAEPILIQEKRADSVFRVIYRVKGYEVIVESGSVVLNEKTQLNEGQNEVSGETVKLSAPRLKKPKVEILVPETMNPEKKKSSWLWSWFVSEAVAAEPSKIAIRFSWEETKGASQYLIQVSRVPEFESVVLEKKVSLHDFVYEMPAPSEKTQLYFRVAGITADGAIGDFSEIEKVNVTPAPTPRPNPKMEVVRADLKKPEAVVAATPTPAPQPKSKPKRKPEPVIESPATNVASMDPNQPDYSLWFWASARYDQRKFKSDATLPNEVSGSGFIPTTVGFDLQKVFENRQYLWVGGSLIFEKARAVTARESDPWLNVSSLSAWATYGRQFQWGPYVATSRRISGDGIALESKSVLMAGVAVALQNDAAIFFRRGGFGWRAQLAASGIGAKGMDAMVWFRRGFMVESWVNGIFLGLKAETRQTDMESSFSGALEVGLKL